MLRDKWSDARRDRGRTQPPNRHQAGRQKGGKGRGRSRDGGTGRKAGRRRSETEAFARIPSMRHNISPTTKGARVEIHVSHAFSSLGRTRQSHSSCTKSTSERKHESSSG